MKKFLLLISAFILIASCSLHRKVEKLRLEFPEANIAISEEHMPEELSFQELIKDTMMVQDADGKQVTIMRAQKDEDGEMVARDILSSAKVTARFRNVAERQGKVDLYFQIIVPPSLLDSRWQLRFQPLLHLNQTTVNLDRVYLTGKDYRISQLRGYQQYERFLSKIVADSAEFRRGELETFLERNLPDLYALKTDSTYVSDDSLASLFGVTHREAVSHYTDKWKVWLNERREEQLPFMYDKYVKAPIETQQIKLDTVLTSTESDFVYEYSQTIEVNPKFSKAGISLLGEIYLSDNLIFTLKSTDTLTYYISSLSSLLKERERYLLDSKDSSASIDTCYAAGLNKIKEQDYKAALTLLQSYADYNTALAYTALGYDASALSILQTLDKGPEVNYLLAIIYSRLKEDKAAVRCYQEACAMNHSLVFRANLDPEIYSLIKKYNIVNQ